MIASREGAWDEFVPFLEFPPELRSIVYTTNAIESLIARFRRAVRHRGHFPTEQAALKVLYLVATERKKNRENLTGRILGWKQILNTFHNRIVHDRRPRRRRARRPPITPPVPLRRSSTADLHRPRRADVAQHRRDLFCQCTRCGVERIRFHACHVHCARTFAPRRHCDEPWGTFVTGDPLADLRRVRVDRRDCCIGRRRSVDLLRDPQQRHLDCELRIRAV